ncbi:hypothetical protein [Rubritalea tangerina]|uniref:Phosphodiester glycosidase domain-containing protein n=1 Tax=Rubritalea tangerina TaxID=430798 RepID=A0ABW4ZB40_9BACT
MKPLLILLLTLVSTFGQYQKVDAPVNSSGRTLSFHIYHFDTSRHPAELHSRPTTISSAINRRSHLAGVALGAPINGDTFTLETQHGMLKVVTGNSNGANMGPQLVAQKSPQPGLDKLHYARRTFLLHNGDKRWAIGYAPSLSQSQLAHALAHISKTTKRGYSLAYQLNAGNSSGLWIRNDSYQPFYLKEFQAPTHVLSIRLK